MKRLGKLMAVPYRKTPRAVATGLAAFIDTIWIEPERTLYGGLLVIDGLGQPVEFVHNIAIAPTGIAWDAENCVKLGTPRLIHTLFDTCRREPDLIVAQSSFGDADFINAEIAPALPFALVTPAQDALPAEWSWINTPPTPDMRASFVAAELERRDLFIEPFSRLAEALRVIYPQLG
jgi:hypothetical protein